MTSYEELMIVFTVIGLLLTVRQSLKMDASDGELNLYQPLSEKIEGLLEVNRDFFATRMVQIQPPSGDGYF